MVQKLKDELKSSSSNIEKYQVMMAAPLTLGATSSLASSKAAYCTQRLFSLRRHFSQCSHSVWMSLQSRGCTQRLISLRLHQSEFVRIVWMSLQSKVKQSAVLTEIVGISTNVVPAQGSSKQPCSIKDVLYQSFVPRGQCGRILCAFQPEYGSVNLPTQTLLCLL